MSVAVLTDRQTNDPSVNGVMKALVYHGPGQRAWETKPKPTIRERGDAIVRITTSQAYDTFADAAKTSALKVVLKGT